MKLEPMTATPNNVRFRVTMENPRTRELERFHLSIDAAQLSRLLARSARENKSKTSQLGAGAIVLEFVGKANV